MNPSAMFFPVFKMDGAISKPIFCSLNISINTEKKVEFAVVAMLQVRR